MTETLSDYRLARAWYVKYPLDAYALGPICFDTPVGADRVVKEAKKTLGELPCEVWPEGTVEEVEEYEYQLEV